MRLKFGLYQTRYLPVVIPSFHYVPSCTENSDDIMMKQIDGSTFHSMTISLSKFLLGMVVKMYLGSHLNKG